MGRGRAKAKQTKVARELKYHSPTTDLAALQRELGSSNSQYDEISEQDGAYADEDDDEFEGDEDDETPNWSRGSR